MPTKEEAIGFVEQAINQYNEDKDEPNKITMYDKYQKYEEHGKMFCHLSFQTPNMDNLLNIPGDGHLGHYYKCWFGAADDGTMEWHISLEANHADDAMQKIMMDIARESIAQERCSNPGCINKIPENRGTMINTEPCDISSLDSAKKSLKGFLNWEQKICEGLGENVTIDSKIALLEKGKNLILTGALGTGKTCLARQMAMKMIAGKTEEKDLSSDGKAKFKRQCRFVQFHPSYDYTDFVEGLRPAKPDENGNIGFELKNGIFKKFCKDALAAWKEDEKEPVEEKCKFIFIIDEISRGEISKIFGELFFSIDPGYRGTDGRVQTQYANIQSNETETIFDTGEGQGWFYVPENVYIIGTMNDIDRSVESFDFAMRRRFVWEEITADDTAASMGLSQDNISRLKALNEAIGKIEGLGSSYHIGGSYFLREQNGKPEQLDCADVWKFRLKPLLGEYLRGMPDAKTHLGDLHKAFDSAYSGGPEE